MVSKTATLILLPHTLTTLLGLLITQSIHHNIPTNIPKLHLLYITLTIRLLLNTPLFLTISLLTHHLLTTLLSPLLAHTLSHPAPPSQETTHATACREQISLKDPTALRKTGYCTRKYGMGRQEAGRGMGGMRWRYEYANILGTVCISGGFLDWEMERVGAGAGAGGVCWMGARREGEEEEGRNSKRMWMRSVMRGRGWI
ncbi:hypothetical protein HYFRA_00009362 [Hymenoscyphus fraxineus]|uniref:Uncharacterized protein n=1 Tax=Hymenoscyphus fraxineus TaxID=746836 RepID=A0A9N9KZX1_9HELO|nr:hypothetical protein HYFRA_00009362 [Hymenoscyphus fraxineus]